MLAWREPSNMWSRLATINWNAGLCFLAVLFVFAAETPVWLMHPAARSLTGTPTDDFWKEMLGLR